MPRAPHSSALLAGRPRAKRSVFSSSRSRTRSTPRSSAMSTRLTFATGVESAAVGVPDEGVGGGEIGARARRRGEPLQRVGDPLEQRSASVAARRGRGSGHRVIHAAGRRPDLAQIEREAPGKGRSGAAPQRRPSAPRRRRLGRRQVVEDRAMRPVVAVAVAHQLAQGRRHRLHLGDAPFEIVEMILGRCFLTSRLGPLVVAPQREQRADFVDRKAEPARPANEAKFVDVAARRSRDRRCRAGRPAAAGRSPRNGGSSWR